MVAPSTILNVNAKKELVIKYLNKEYTLNAAGELHGDIGGTISKLAADSTPSNETIINHALNDVKAQKALPQKVYDVLKTQLKHFDTLGAEKEGLAEVEKNFKSVEKVLAGLKAKNHKAVYAEMTKNSGVQEYFTEEVYKEIKTSGYNLNLHDSFNAAKEGLQTIIKDAAPTVEKIEKHLIANYAHIDKLNVSAEASVKMMRNSKGAVDFDAIKASVKKEVTALEPALEDALKKVSKTGKELAGYKALGANATEAEKKATQAAQEAFTKAEAELGKITGGKYGAAGLQHFHATNKSLIDEVTKVSTSAKTSVDNAMKSVVGVAEKAAEKGGSSFFSWKKSKAEIEEIAQKSKIAVEEVGFFKKAKPGALALGAAAIAGIGYSIVATDKGKKGRAADLNQEQIAQMQQQMEGQGQVATR